MGLSVLVTVPAVAQERSAAFEPWQAPMSVPPASAAVTVEPERRDHRYLGLAIGGIAIGAFGAYVGASIDHPDCLTQPGGGCGNADEVGSAIVGGLVGAAVGGTLGYIIGRWGNEKARPVTADSTAS